MRRWTKQLIACAMLLFAAAPAWALSPWIMFFDTGSVRLDRRGEEMVANAVMGMRALDTREIEIVGTTDRVGSVADNLALSRRRAEAVRAALLARGMSSHVRVRIVAAGETQPLVDTADGVPEPQNRYVAIVLQRMCVDWQDGSRRTEAECATPLPD
jgi:outer membrane protein OmpA-like peptidoglycan-associated protein